VQVKVKPTYIGRDEQSGIGYPDMANGHVPVSRLVVKMYPEDHGTGVPRPCCGCVATVPAAHRHVELVPQQESRRAVGGQDGAAGGPLA
jgi:hypothetical protein